MEKEFNLLDEPWIRVMSFDGNVEEVSILELFQKAHTYRQFAGELPTQDVAIMRIILAILHAVFGKQEDGEYLHLPSDKEGEMTVKGIYRRWKWLWSQKEFPMDYIAPYLERWRDRFWLFHPEYPFYQVAGLEIGTFYSAAKLNGEISESGNKIKLFAPRTQESKKELTYAEAARWLPYVIGYDDTSAKPSQRGLDSPGVGWLGKLGLIYAQGSNLFETLILNLVLLEKQNTMWENEKPTWHNENPRTDERVKIVVPNNPSEMLTIQSRRILLQREEEKVTGYRLLGGDFYSDDQEVLLEKMTVWRDASKSKNSGRAFQPKRHMPERQLWRDFSSLIGATGKHIPGVVDWIVQLYNEQITKNVFQGRSVSFNIAAIKYGDKDFFADDVFSDSLTFSALILVEQYEDFILHIENEVEWTDKLVQGIGYLASDLAKASGDRMNVQSKSLTARQKAYDFLDVPFREWLAQIDPGKESSFDNYSETWRKEARKIILQFGKIMAAETGPGAFVGRTITENKVTKRYTSPEAFHQFRRYIARVKL